jgi:hypothetical protein
VKTNAARVVWAWFALASAPLWAANPLWEARQSPEAVQQTARQFVELLDLGPDARVTGLLGRLELRPIAQQLAEGNDVAVMEAFSAYFFAKLRNPTAYGLSAHDVSPYVRGVCGEGAWPAALFDPNVDPAKVIPAADLLLQGRLRIADADVEIGHPGSVNWMHPYGQGQPIPHDKTPNLGIVSGTAFFPLAQAYLLTGDGRYLERWQQYMDDWSLHSTYVSELHLCEVPSGVNGMCGFLPVQMARVLGGLCAAMPAGQAPLPPRVLAQVLTRLLRDYPLPALTYARSNCHNWTPSPTPLLTALIYDEFTVSASYFREGMRRNIQDNAVTQNLRDGSENQQCPWYNHNYLGVGGALRLFAARQNMPVYREPGWIRPYRHDAQWRAEIIDHLRERVTYFIHLRTPQNEWPIPFRGGDKRAADAASFDASPQAYINPQNRAILAAVNGDGDARPDFDSEWFPYGGYNIVRTGWGPLDACGAMFSSPNPGAYGGYRSRSNNNTFGLGAFNQDLLIDDCVGHYMYVGSPITVDGRPQFFHARDGIYKVGGLANHKTYMVSAWTEPANWRWHASDQFNLMEGVYDGPYGNPAELERRGERYGPEEAAQATLGADQTIRGVQHQRLVHYARAAGVWVVTDRLTSPQPRQFRQVWMLPINPGKAPGFEDGEVTLDEQRGIIATVADRRIGNDKGPTKANVELHQFASTPLRYERRGVEKDAKNHYQMNGRAEVYANWSAQGTSQVITAIHARPGVDGALQSVEPITAAGVQGFRAVTAAGAVVQYLSATDGAADLKLGNVAARAQSLLLTQAGGVALGCRALQVAGQPVQLEHEDVEFRLDGDRAAAVTAIYRPIDPVVIGPQRNVFVDRVDVTMTSRTPGVEIRYTLDQSEPTPQSTLYQGSLVLTESAVIKARAYRRGVTANPPQTSGTHATPTSLAVFRRVQPIAAEPARELKPGLQARYWQGDWSTLWHLADRRPPAAQGVASTLFDLSVVPATNPPLGDAPAPRQAVFAVEYSGFIDVPADGVYTFHAPREFVYPDTDAGYELRVFVGNRTGEGGYRNRVIGMNEWFPSTRLHALGNWSVALAKGLHPIRVYYLDYRTDAARRLNDPRLRPYIWPGVTPDLRVSGPDLEPQSVPASWLRHGLASASTATPSRSDDMTFIPLTAAALSLMVVLQPGDIGFQNQLPTDAGWQKQGTLEVAMVEDEGQQVVDLKDSSETDMAQFRISLPADVGRAMAQQGFEAEMRFKLLASGNDALVLRMETFGSMMFSFDRDTKNNRLVVASYDSVNKKQVRASVEGLDRYVTLKCVWEPQDDPTVSGKATLYLDGQEALSFQTLRPARAANGVELGGRDPKRQGHLRVASFRMAPRAAATKP